MTIDISLDLWRWLQDHGLASYIQVAERRPTPTHGTWQLALAQEIVFVDKQTSGLLHPFLLPIQDPRGPTQITLIHAKLHNNVVRGKLVDSIHSV